MLCLICDQSRNENKPPSPDFWLGNRCLHVGAGCDPTLSEHFPERVEWIPVSCKRTGTMASRTWTEQEVWDILHECICDALGVKPEEVISDARMVEDLGMN